MSFRKYISGRTHGFCVPAHVVLGRANMSSYTTENSIVSNTVSSIRADLGLDPETNLGSRTKMIPCSSLSKLHTHQSGDVWLLLCLSSCLFCVVICTLMWLLFHNHPACRTHLSGRKNRRSVVCPFNKCRAGIDSPPFSTHVQVCFLTVLCVTLSAWMVFFF